jgi:hypothetical protein
MAGKPLPIHGPSRIKAIALRTSSRATEEDRRRGCRQEFRHKLDTKRGGSRIPGAALQAFYLLLRSLRGLDLNQRPLGYESGGPVPHRPFGAIPCRSVRASCRRSPSRAAEVRVVLCNSFCNRPSEGRGSPVQLAGGDSRSGSHRPPPLRRRSRGRSARSSLVSGRAPNTNIIREKKDTAPHHHGWVLGGPPVPIADVAHIEPGKRPNNVGHGVGRWPVTSYLVVDDPYRPHGFTGVVVEEAPDDLP